MGLQLGSNAWPRMKDRLTKLNQEYFNPIWELIDRRLHDLETLKADWVAAVEDITRFGLQRIDEVLSPAFAKINRISESGFLIAHSASSETLEVGEISTFVIDDEDERELFAPSAFVTLTRPDDNEHYAFARVISYVREVGSLDVEVLHIVGDEGPHDDWEIIAGTGVTEYVASRMDEINTIKTDILADNAATQAAVEADRSQIQSYKDIVLSHATEVATNRALAATAATTATTQATLALGYRDAAATYAAQTAGLITYSVGSQAAMLALSAAVPGDIAFRTDLGKAFVLSNSSYGVLSNWKEFPYPVISVSGRTGAVVLNAADIANSGSTGRALMTSATPEIAKTALSLAITDIPSLSGEISAANILTKIKTVDGSGSGLDADRIHNTLPGAAGLGALSGATPRDVLFGAGLLSESVSIANNAAASVPINGASTGSMLIIIPNTGPSYSGMVFFRQNAPQFCTKITGGANFDAIEDGGVGGSTGTVGSVTVAIASSGNLRIENRSGSTKSFVVFTIPSGTVTGSL